MEKKVEKVEDQGLMHSFSGKSKESFLSMKIIAVFLVVILFGIGSGYLLAGKGNASNASTVTNVAGLTKSQIKAGQSYGSSDTSSYKDTAEGTMQNGGIDGEGQYHLVRPGGASQNVYLTSSVVDLSLFINHKVKVWGATQTAQHAGWLMDVGKVQVE